MTLWKPRDLKHKVTRLQINQLIFLCRCAHTAKEPTAELHFLGTDL